MLDTVTVDRRAPVLDEWRAALDPPGVPHHEAWATLDLLSALWQPAPVGSLLTPSGAPLEFTFRSGSDALVYTAEPGQPGYSPHTKWSVIRAVTAACGMNQPPPVGAVVEMLRQQPGQRFGCWLGVRLGSGTVSYKIYQEVTPAARDRTRCALYAALPALDPGIAVVPQLVGHTLSDGPSEYYLRVPDPRPSTLHALLRAAGVSEQLRLCSESLAWLAGIPVTRLHERLRLGLSYRLTPDQPPVASLFIHAVQISERNLPVRARLLELAAQLGLDLARYARATAFLGEFDPVQPLHGLIGLTIEPAGRLSLSAGVSPPSLKLSCDTSAYVRPSEK